jgi:hypothetical protein
MLLYWHSHCEVHASPMLAAALLLLLLLLLLLIVCTAYTSIDIRRKLLLRSHLRIVQR